MAEEVQHRRLDSHFGPRAIAFVGASARSRLLRNLWKSALASVVQLFRHKAPLVALRDGSMGAQPLPPQPVILAKSASRILVENEAFPLNAPTRLATPPFLPLRVMELYSSEMQSWEVPCIAMIVSDAIDRLVTIIRRLDALCRSLLFDLPVFRAPDATIVLTETRRSQS